MHFFPGAINRWRAGEHVAAMKGAGMDILSATREQRHGLPVLCKRPARAYRGLNEAELRSTAIDIVGRGVG